MQSVLTDRRGMLRAVGLCVLVASFAIAVKLALSASDTIRMLAPWYWFPLTWILGPLLLALRPRDRRNASMNWRQRTAVLSLIFLLGVADSVTGMAASPLAVCEKNADWCVIADNDDEKPLIGNIGVSPYVDDWYEPDQFCAIEIYRKIGIFRVVVARYSLAGNCGGSISGELAPDHSHYVLNTTPPVRIWSSPMKIECNPWEVTGTTASAVAPCTELELRPQWAMSKAEQEQAWRHAHPEDGR